MAESLAGLNAAPGDQHQAHNAAKHHPSEYGCGLGHHSRIAQPSNLERAAKVNRFVAVRVRLRQV